MSKVALKHLQKGKTLLLVICISLLAKQIQATENHCKRSLKDKMLPLAIASIPASFLLKTLWETFKGASFLTRQLFFSNIIKATNESYAHIDSSKSIDLSEGALTLEKLPCDTKNKNFPKIIIYGEEHEKNNSLIQEKLEESHLNPQKMFGREGYLYEENSAAIPFGIEEPYSRALAIYYHYYSEKSLGSKNYLGMELENFLFDRSLKNPRANLSLISILKRPLANSKLEAFLKTYEHELTTHQNKTHNNIDAQSLLNLTAQFYRLSLDDRLTFAEIMIEASLYAMDKSQTLTSQDKEIIKNTNKNQNSLFMKYHFNFLVEYRNRAFASNLARLICKAQQEGVKEIGVIIGADHLNGTEEKLLKIGQNSGVSLNIDAIDLTRNN